MVLEHTIARNFKILVHQEFSEKSITKCYLCKCERSEIKVCNEAAQMGTRHSELSIYK